MSSPFYTWPTAGDSVNIGGAVYVYLNGPQGITNNTQPIVLARRMTLTECKKVDCTNARFGLSIARIGDVDLDGFEG